MTNLIKYNVSLEWHTLKTEFHKADTHFNQLLHDILAAKKLSKDNLLGVPGEGSVYSADTTSINMAQNTFKMLVRYIKGMPPVKDINKTAILVPIITAWIKGDENIGLTIKALPDLVPFHRLCINFEDVEIATKQELDMLKVANTEGEPEKQEVITQRED